MSTVAVAAVRRVGEARDGGALAGLRGDFCLDVLHVRDGRAQRFAVVARRGTVVARAQARG